MVDFLTAVQAGIETGAIYALVALGLGITYATSNAFNFAHGEFVMVGAVLGVVLWQSMDVPVGLALLLTVLVASAAGAATERVAIRPFAAVKDAAGWMIATLGVAIMLTAGFTIAITREPGSTDTRLFPSFLPRDRPWIVGEFLLNPNRMLLVGLLVVVAGGLLWFTKRTHVGRALGAVADDREAAAIRGIPVNRLTMLAFAIGAAVAALTGFAMGPVTQASVTIGLGLTIKGFVASAIGGMGSLGGAVVGGLALGLTEQFALRYLGTQWQDLIILAVLLVMLSIKPEGFFSRDVRAV